MRLIYCASGKTVHIRPFSRCIEPLCASKPGKSVLVFPPGSSRSLKSDNLLEATDHEVLVACADDGAVVAWVHAFVALRVESDPFIEISGFVVAEPFRGRGVGKRLLAAIEAWVLAQGVGQLRVRRRSDRAAARAFYAGLGFARTKEQNVFDKRVQGVSQTARRH